MTEVWGLAERGGYDSHCENKVKFNKIMSCNDCNRILRLMSNNLNYGGMYYEKSDV